MREAIGGTWITQLVILFMLIFVAFLALSLNYTKAFKMKNDILTMIEKHEGITTDSDGSVQLINNYLIHNGYAIIGSCPIDSYGVTNLNNNTVELVTNNSSKYYYCISKVSAPSENHLGKSFYKVRIFFYFNLPVIGDLFKFDVSGGTNDIIIPADNLETVSE